MSDKKKKIKNLKKKTGLSYEECKEAVEFSEKNPEYRPESYLYAKQAAIRTPLLNILERVQLFCGDVNVRSEV